MIENMKNGLNCSKTHIYFLYSSPFSPRNIHIQSLLFPKMLTMVLFWHCNSKTFHYFQELLFIKNGSTTVKNGKPERGSLLKDVIYV